MYPIVITAGDVTVHAELGDTPTAQQVWDALPFDSVARRWGGEVYFETPVEAQPEPGARDEMAAGEIAYWPAGRALCIFFGPTPVSRGEEPRAASPVTPLGRVTSGAGRLTRVEAGAPVRVIRALAG